MFRRPVAVAVGCGNGIAPRRAAEMCYDVWGGGREDCSHPHTCRFPTLAKKQNQLGKGTDGRQQSGLWATECDMMRARTRRRRTKAANKRGES